MLPAATCCAVSAARRDAPEADGVAAQSEPSAEKYEVTDQIVHATDRREADDVTAPARGGLKQFDACDRDDPYAARRVRFQRDDRIAMILCVSGVGRHRKALRLA